MKKPSPWAASFAEISDANFILDSWYAEAVDVALKYSRMSPTTIATYIPMRVRLLFSRHACAVVRVERLPVGFTCYSFERRSLKPIVHALYVQPPMRRQGIGTTLLLAAGVKDGADGWHTSFAQGKAWPRAARNLHQNLVLLDYNPTAIGYPP